jgi:hypothetical protein
MIEGQDQRRKSCVVVLMTQGPDIADHRRKHYGTHHDDWI